MKLDFLLWGSIVKEMKLCNSQLKLIEQFGLLTESSSASASPSASVSSGLSCLPDAGIILKKASKLFNPS